MLLHDLLRAVRDAPDEFAPRLAYADAPAAAGDPLAELIRVQCALARGPRRADGGRTRRSTDASTRYSPLRSVVDHHVWWRGLLGVNVSVAGFLQAHADLVCVRFVDVSDWSVQLEHGAWRELTANPDICAVTLLGIRGRFPLDTDDALRQDDDVSTLAASPHAHRLVGLDLSFNRSATPGWLLLPACRASLAYDRCSSVCVATAPWAVARRERCPPARQHSIQEAGRCHRNCQR